MILTRYWKESYGGHYGPVFAEYIEAKNAEQGAGTTNISLETVTIINGWISPLIQVRELFLHRYLALIEGK